MPLVIAGDRLITFDTAPGNRKNAANEIQLRRVVFQFENTRGVPFQKSDHGWSGFAFGRLFPAMPDTDDAHGAPP